MSFLIQDQLNFTKNDDIEIWHIDTFYKSSNWLFVEKLIFNVDGKISNFTSEPSPKHEIGTPISATDVAEENQFVLSDSFIEDLHKAKSVSVRLEGRDYYQDKLLEPADIHNMISFIDWVYKNGKIKKN